MRYRTQLEEAYPYLGQLAYVTHFPCIVCAKLLVAAGISVIKFHFDYNNRPMVDEIFRENGIGMYPAIAFCVHYRC